MLLVGQALLVASAVFPVYLFARRKEFSRNKSLIIAGIFLLNAMLIRVIWFDFHELAFAVPLAAWFVYAIEFRRWVLLYLVAALLLLTKENLSLFVAFAGIFLIFRKQYLPGAILSILGVVWFILVTKVLIPFFAGDTGYGYWSYGHLGPDLPSAVLGMLQNPVFAVSLLFWPLVKMVTLVRMSITVVGLCYLSPLVLLSAPIILERFLSSTPTHWMFGFHYGAVIAPVFVLAFIDALHRLRNNKLRITKPLRRRHAISVILWGVLAVNAGLFVAFTSSSLLNPSYYRLTADESAGYNLIKQIPSDVTVCTSNRIVPHLGRSVNLPL